MTTPESAVISRGWIGLGALAMAAGLAGVGALGAVLAPSVTPDDGRPPCVRSLDPRVGQREVQVTEDAEGHTYLLGIDRSPSNATLSNVQLEQAAAFAGARPWEDGYGILFVSDRSDRSSTPDLLEEAHLSRTAEIDAPWCGTSCSPSSLFEKACWEQWEAALEEERQTMAEQLTAEQQADHALRSKRLDAWLADTQEYWPAPGTSLLGFWQKVADLPVVRRSPASVTIVLWSDLQEERTTDRKLLQALVRAQTPPGDACPDDSPIPPALAGTRVVLLQSIGERTAGLDWASWWERALGCAGVTVERYRYSPSVGLAQILE